MELKSNGGFWDAMSLDDARGFLWGHGVGPDHPSRAVAHKWLYSQPRASKTRPTILEVPCAAGAEYEALSKVGEVTCMDRTPVMLEVIQERYPEARTVAGDIRKIPLDDGSFDYVYARAIFEHLPSLEDTKLAMEECVRVARLGCVFSFFLPPGDTESIDWNGQFFNNHYRFEDIMSVLAPLGKVSFEKVSVEGTDFVDDGLIFYVKKA